MVYLLVNKEYHCVCQTINKFMQSCIGWNISYQLVTVEERVKTQEEEEDIFSIHETKFGALISTVTQLYNTH